MIESRENNLNMNFPIRFYIVNFDNFFPQNLVDKYCSNFAQRLLRDLFIRYNFFVINSQKILYEKSSSYPNLLNVI